MSRYVCFFSVVLTVVGIGWTGSRAWSWTHNTLQSDQPKQVEETPKEIKAKIAEAYEQSKKAKTHPELTSVIDLCQQVLAADLKKADRTYVNSLLSWGYNRRGEVLARQAADSRAKKQVDQADRLDADAMADFSSSIQHDSKRWRAYHNRGVSHAQRGAFDEAVQDFDRTIELHQGHLHAWRNRAEVHYAQQQFTLALQDYDHVLSQQPKDVEALTGRGHTYFQLGKLDQALADHQQVVGLAPDQGQALANRADVYQAMKSWEKAKADYRAALEKNQKLGGAYRGIAWLMATCPEIEVRNPVLALQAAKRAIELDGDTDPRYLDTLAAAQAANGQFDEARQTASKAIEIAAEPLVSGLKQRLALYSEQRPFLQR